MAKYRLLEKAFINERLWEINEEIDLPDDVIPGPHMLPMDSAARNAIKKAGVVNIAVGMPVARHPPHRSVREELSHTAPTLVNDAKSLIRIKMPYFRRG